MKHLKIKTASNKVLLVSSPTSIFELKTGIYEDVINKWIPGDTPEDLIKLFAVVTGQLFEDYYSSSDMNLERIMLETISFIFNGELKRLETLSTPETYNGLTIPRQLGSLTLGQNLHIRKRVEQVDDIRGHVAFAAAVYLQPLLDGTEFNDKRIDYWEARLKDEPVTVIFPIGFFFLSQRRHSGRSLISYLRQIYRTMLYSIRSGKQLLNKLRLNY